MVAFVADFTNLDFAAVTPQLKEDLILQLAAAASQANYNRDGLPTPVPTTAVVFTGISPGSVLIALRVSFPFGSHSTPFVKWLNGELERAGNVTAGEPKWVPVPPAALFTTVQTTTDFAMFQPVRTFRTEMVATAYASPPPPMPSPPPTFEQTLEEEPFLFIAAVTLGSLLGAVTAVHIWLAWRREMRLLKERDELEKSIAQNEKAAGKVQLDRLERMLTMRRQEAARGSTPLGMRAFRGAAQNVSTLILKPINLGADLALAGALTGMAMLPVEIPGLRSTLESSRKQAATRLSATGREERVTQKVYESGVAMSEIMSKVRHTLPPHLRRAFYLQRTVWPGIHGSFRESFYNSELAIHVSHTGLATGSYNGGRGRLHGHVFSSKNMLEGTYTEQCVRRTLLSSALVARRSLLPQRFLGQLVSACLGRRSHQLTLDRWIARLHRIIAEG